MLRLALVFLSLAPAAMAHPHHYTEQQVSLTLGPAGITAEISIIPSDIDGAATFARLDSDGDGVLSDDEMRSLATEVLAASGLTLNGTALPLALTATNSPAQADMAQGHATITIRAGAAHVPAPADRIRFAIAYDRFAAEWSVQPWLAEGFPPGGQLPVIRRGGDTAAVEIVFPAEAAQ